MGDDTGLAALISALTKSVEANEIQIETYRQENASLQAELCHVTEMLKELLQELDDREAGYNAAMAQKAREWRLKEKLIQERIKGLEIETFSLASAKTSSDLLEESVTKCSNSKRLRFKSKLKLKLLKLKSSSTSLSNPNTAFVSYSKRYHSKNMALTESLVKSLDSVEDLNSQLQKQLFSAGSTYQGVEYQNGTETGRKEFIDSSLSSSLPSHKSMIISKDESFFNQPIHRVTALKETSSDEYTKAVKNKFSPFELAFLHSDINAIDRRSQAPHTEISVKIKAPPKAVSEMEKNLTACSVGCELPQHVYLQNEVFVDHLKRLRADLNLIIMS